MLDQIGTNEDSGHGIRFDEVSLRTIRTIGFEILYAMEMGCPVLWVLTLLSCFADSNSPIVIAHRGASGYAVEHTEAAKAMAHAQGADYIEQDVVLSKDGEFVED